MKNLAEKKMANLIKKSHSYEAELQSLKRLRILGVILIVTAHMFFFSSGIFDRFENIFLDQFFKMRGPIKTHPDIVFIEIDEKSFRTIGRWPWPRHYQAIMTDILRLWGAQKIVFDLIFTMPGQDSSGDSALIKAFEKTDNLYLPVFRENNPAMWIHSLPEIEKHAREVGHVNIRPDSDGVLRRIKPVIRDHGESHWNLAFHAAYENPELEISRIPKDAEGNLIINWAAKWGFNFRHYSYVDIFKSYQAWSRGEKPVISPEELRGKICLIGMTSMTAEDMKPIPLETVYPGLGGLGNILNTLLTRQWLYPMPYMFNIACFFVLATFALIAFHPFRDLKTILIASLLIALWVGICFFLFCSYGILVPIFVPILMVLALVVFCAVLSKMQGDLDRLHFFRLSTRDGLTGLYSRRHFDVLLAGAIGESHIRNEPLTLIMMDVDNFKQINDNYGHPAGDTVLLSLAQNIQNSLRTIRPAQSADVVARYGGEEFAVVLRNVDEPMAYTIAERLRTAIQTNQVFWKDIRIPISVSLGIANLSPYEVSTEALVTRADNALYRAKQWGKNRTCIAAV